MLSFQKGLIRKMADFSALTKLAPSLEIMGSQGAFLLAGPKDDPNVMTIGWGTAGVMWSLPVFTAPVRLSRHTHGLLEVGSVFTVSFPGAGKMKKELGFCGSHSGRDCKKVQEGGLTLLPAKEIESSVVKGCALYLECRVLNCTDLSLETFSAAQKERWYSGGDEGNTHTLFCAQILACYEGEN